MVARWPSLQESALYVDEEALTDFQTVQRLVRVVRNARAEYRVDAGKKIGLVLCVSTEAKRRLLQHVEAEKEVMALLARLDQAETRSVDMIGVEREQIQSRMSEEAGPCVHLIVEDGVDLYLPQSGLIDKEKETVRLKKQSEKLVKDITVLEQRLSNEKYISKAPPELVQEVKDKLSDMQEQLKNVDASLLALLQ